VKFEAPTAPLKTISADTPEKATPAEKQTVVATAAPPTPNTKMEGIRRFKHIVAAQSLTVVAGDPIVTNVGADETQELRLLAGACASAQEEAHNDINLGRQEGEDSTLDSQLGCYEGESALGVIKERFYEYPKQVVALLKLGYSVELEQGVFLRIQPSTQRKLHPDLSRLAREVQREQRERETFDGLLTVASCILWKMTSSVTRYFTRQHNPARHTTGTVRNHNPQLRLLVEHNLPEILIWPSWRQVQTSGMIIRLCLKL
jgi:hypothetical protein